MTTNVSNYPIDIYVSLYDSSKFPLAVQAVQLGIAQNNNEISECRLIFQVSLELYKSIDSKALFNLNPVIRIPRNLAEFKSLENIEIEVTLKPELLSHLSKQATNIAQITTYLSKQSRNLQITLSEITRLKQSSSCLQVLYPLLFTENWLALSVKQSLPAGEIGYRTLWSHFRHLGTSIADASQEQISESIANFMQDLASFGLNSQTQQLTPESLKETAAFLRQLASQTTDITSPDIIIAKSLIFDLIVNFFREDNWQFIKLEGQTVLRLAFEGKNSKWDCYAQAIEKKQQFVFYSVCPIQVPQEKRQAIAEFITRANYGMIIGNFELDFNDGEIRYKTSIDVEGDRLTSALIKQIVYANIIMMDQYLPGIVAVVENNISPVDAIAQIEDIKTE